LAIFYFIYAFFPKERSLNRALLICIAVVFAISLPFQLTDVRWAELLALPASIFAALGLEKLVRLLTQEKGEALAIMALLLFFLVWQSAISVFGSGLADAQNHQYFQALSWIRNNTAKNATFLTLWDDGSLLEGYANRTSYSDSIQGMNESGSMVLFSRFLFAKAGNFTYISEVQPDYLLVRKVWLNYSTSLLAEGSLPSNTPINGTNIQALTVGFLNSTYLHIVYRNNDSIIYKVKG
jgi:asparagine N-glycosylation enzyme membrane subunit Stt3